MQRRAPLRRATGLSRGTTTGLSRGKPRARDEDGMLRWRLAVLGKRCVVCGGKAVQGHHVTEAAVLRREGHADKLWDLRNMVPVCSYCHGRHHLGARRITEDLLPAPALAFASELGLDWWIERTYPANPAHARDVDSSA